MRKNRSGLTALFMMLVLAGRGSQAAAPKAAVRPKAPAEKEGGQTVEIIKGLSKSEAAF